MLGLGRDRPDRGPEGRLDPAPNEFFRVRCTDQVTGEWSAPRPDKNLERRPNRCQSAIIQPEEEAIVSERTTSPRETPHDAIQEAPPPPQSGRPGPALSHPDLWRALLRRAGAQVRVARARDAGRRRLPDLPRRAEPGWQPRAQPGVVRHDLDGARGGKAHRRIAEQELR